jgi:release factor glutamine methyltransferase
LTLHEKLAEGRAHLVAAGIAHAEAAIDVDLYARTILGWDRARLIAEGAGTAPAGLEPTFSQWIARRARREPSAYIVGVREFWGLEFVVTPAVLIPRPETELIVEEALRILGSAGHPRVADIGTGSGCVAVALAHAHSGCRIVATDLSAAALDVARANAARHHVAHRIAFVNTSYLDGVGGPFDLITANPPYVKEGDRPGLSLDVRHEPDLALFGGPEGLRDIGGVLEAASRTLIPGGWLVMEFGFGQDDAVEAMVSAQRGLHLAGVRSDLQGIPRTAIIQRQ